MSAFHPQTPLIVCHNTNNTQRGGVKHSAIIGRENGGKKSKKKTRGTRLSLLPSPSFSAPTPEEEKTFINILTAYSNSKKKNR
jgi:hypothetical protein